MPLQTGRKKVSNFLRFPAPRNPAPPNYDLTSTGQLFKSMGLEEYTITTVESLGFDDITVLASLSPRQFDEFTRDVAPPTCA